MRIHRLFFALLILAHTTLLSAQQSSSQYEQAASAYQSGDFSQAEQLWVELAKEGNADAQYALGIMHLKKEAQQPDDSTAFRYLVEAAKKQHVPSMFNLGVAYWEGRGVKRQPEKALNWWEVAAQRDDASAQYNLGLAYYIGEGRKQSTPKAIYWVKQAAKNGHPQAGALLLTLQGKSKQDKSIQAAQASTPVESDKPGRSADTVSMIHLSNRKAALYAAPSENSVQVLNLDKGTSLRSLKTAADWTQVLVARSYPVWVYETFVADLGEGAGKITGNKVNIRPSASTNNQTAPPLGQLNDGDRVAILSKKSPWVQIMPPQPFPAWIKSEFLN